MLKKFTLAFLALGAFGLAFINVDVMSYSAGSPGGRTGAGSDANGPCAPCHASTSTFDNTIISSNIPGDGWRAGMTYQITCTISGSSSDKIGFEMTCDDSGNNKAGTFTSTDNTTQTLGANQSITHTSAGTTASSGNITWTYDWTAPSVGTGCVTFFGAFNETNNNSASSGDNILADTMVVCESVFSGIADVSQNTNLEVFPNPAVDFIKVKTLNGNSIKNWEIISMAGKKVLQGGNLPMSSQINVTALETGIYFLRVTDDTQTNIHKFLKQ